MQKHEVKLALLSATAKRPTQATDGSFGYDVFADLETPTVIPRGETALIPTGVTVELPGYLGLFVVPRSGMSHRDKIRVSNSPGLVDFDYRGEIYVTLHNLGDRKYVINPGDAIAQLTFPLLVRPKFVDEFTPTQTTRGSGGFGSTGKQAGSPNTVTGENDAKSPK